MINVKCCPRLRLYNEEVALEHQTFPGGKYQPRKSTKGR